jgi:hypothetical protein
MFVYKKNICNRNSIAKYTHGKRLNYSGIYRFRDFGLFCALKVNLGETAATELFQEAVGLPKNEYIQSKRELRTIRFNNDKERQGSKEYKIARRNTNYRKIVMLGLELKNDSYKNKAAMISRHTTNINLNAPHIKNNKEIIKKKISPSAVGPADVNKAAMCTLCKTSHAVSKSATHCLLYARIRKTKTKLKQQWGLKSKDTVKKFLEHFHSLQNEKNSSNSIGICSSSSTSSSSSSTSSSCSSSTGSSSSTSSSSSSGSSSSTSSSRNSAFFVDTCAKLVVVSKSNGTRSSSSGSSSILSSTSNQFMARTIISHEMLRNPSTTTTTSTTGHEIPDNSPEVLHQQPNVSWNSREQEEDEVQVKIETVDSNFGE